MTAAFSLTGFILLNITRIRQAGYDSTLKNYWELLAKNVPTTPMMMDNPADMPRTTNVFERGNWLVKGDDVKPDVPQSLNPLPKDAPRNRLGLAMWLTDKKNPLTARAMVNSIWEQLFGNGIVETLEDLGTQGVEPTHRELLDYLSYQFMNEYKWSMKKLTKRNCNVSNIQAGFKSIRRTNGKRSLQ